VHKVFKGYESKMLFVSSLPPVILPNLLTFVRRKKTSNSALPSTPTPSNTRIQTWIPPVRPSLLLDHTWKQTMLNILLFVVLLPRFSSKIPYYWLYGKRTLPSIFLKISKNVKFTGTWCNTKNYTTFILLDVK